MYKSKFQLILCFNIDLKELLSSLKIFKKIQQFLSDREDYRSLIGKIIRSPKHNAKTKTCSFDFKV
jgi:hypothetical protein